MSVFNKMSAEMSPDKEWRRPREGVMTSASEHNNLRIFSSLFILSTMAEVFDGDTASTMMASVVANKQRLTRKEYRDQKNI